MSKKRSKSRERELKRAQRQNLDDVQEELIRDRDALRKREERKVETDEFKKDRNAKKSLYMKKKREAEAKEKADSSVEERRRQKRLSKGIGMENGVEASWIEKSLEEMSVEERRGYNRQMRKLSRNRDSEVEKSLTKMKDRKYQYDKRDAGYRHRKTEDLRQPEEDDDYLSHDSNEDMMFDNQGNAIPDDLEAESAMLAKYEKERKKEELKRAAPPLPDRQMCEY